MRIQLVFQLLMWAAPAVVHAQVAGRATRAGADTSLLGAVLRHVVEGSGMPVRVDPRPLNPDPALVELKRSVAAAVPDRVSSVRDPLAATTRRVLSRRSRVISRLGLREADAFSYPNCPGIMFSAPVLNRVERRPGNDCPAEQFSAVIVSVPRAGGAYWPGNLDQRHATPRGAWSVRVITRDLGPLGASSGAYDYVAERDRSGSWRIVKVVSLLIVE
jgi:hypothetical protein